MWPSLSDYVINKVTVFTPTCPTLPLFVSLHVCSVTFFISSTFYKVVQVTQLMIFHLQFSFHHNRCVWFGGLVLIVLLMETKCTYKAFQAHIKKERLHHNCGLCVSLT